MIGRSIALALSAVLTLAQVGVPGDAAGQEGGASANKEARPKVVHDHQVRIEGGGYGVRVYFEEGKTFSDPDAHVFYEPLIYLELDENGKLEHELRQDGDSWVLSMYFRVESDWDSLRKTIREELLSEARKIMPKEEYENVDFAYRIKPMYVESAYFQSTSPRQDGFYRSEPFPSKSFNESGRYHIYFRMDSEDEARSFLSDLVPNEPNRDPTDNLRFVYRFSGVSDAVCEATFSGSDFQSVDAKATIEGPGGVGYVTRDNATAFAEQVVQQENITARCADAEWADYVVGQLMRRLGDVQEVDLTDGWETLQKFNLLDENDLAADLENRAKDITKEVVRNQLLAAIAQAKSEAEATASSESMGGELGVEGGYFTGNAAFNTAESLSESSSESATEARKEFRDIMEKSGIFGEWEGEKYTPKSLQVYSEEDMNKAWNTDIEIRYEFPSGVVVERSMELLIGSYRNDFVDDIVKRLESAFLRVDAVDDRVREVVALATRAAHRANRAAHRANFAADSARAAQKNADAATQFARGAPTRVKVCTFELDLPPNNSISKYPFSHTSFYTGVNSDAAFIVGSETLQAKQTASVSGARTQMHGCGAADFRMVKRRGQEEEGWYIHISEYAQSSDEKNPIVYYQSCRRVAIDVAFMHGDFVNSAEAFVVHDSDADFFDNPATRARPMGCDFSAG